MPPVRRRALLAAALLLPAAAAAAPVRNGFDLADAAVPVDEILPGGPPKDGIPAIDDPAFEDAEAAAAWLAADDQVIGVDRGGIQRAYPLRILNWHEVVNDAYGDESVVVTYCPLCGTGIVFAPPAGAAGGFGVSGLLYNSDVLLYDRATSSLWSQILGRAVTGPRRGEELPAVPALQTSWEHWRALHPATEVLSRATGFARNYSSDPYAGYADSDSVFFPLRHRPPPDGPLGLKERVLGLRHGGAAKAYPHSRLAAHGQSRFADEVGGLPVFIHWDAAAGAAWAADAAGRPLAAVDGYWFAWYAFHPATEVFAPPAP